MTILSEAVLSAFVLFIAIITLAVKITSTYFFVIYRLFGKYWQHRVDLPMKEPATCPVETTLAVLGGRWKVLILRELLSGTRRYNELHRSLDGITQKMLTQQLRELERHGIVSRTVYPQVPPRVEYALTPVGETLKPVLDAMHAWGVRHMQDHRP